MWGEGDEKVGDSKRESEMFQMWGKGV